MFMGKPNESAANKTWLSNGPPAADCFRLPRPHFDYCNALEWLWSDEPLQLAVVNFNLANVRRIFLQPYFSLIPLLLCLFFFFVFFGLNFEQKSGLATALFNALAAWLLHVHQQQQEQQHSYLGAFHVSECNHFVVCLPRNAAGLS